MKTYILTFDVNPETNEVMCREIPTLKLTRYGRYQGFNLLIHHIVASGIHNPNPSVLTIVDHINGDTYNNHEYNLRHMSRSLNAHNIKKTPKISDTCVTCWYKKRKVKFANQFNIEHKEDCQWWMVPMQDDLRYMTYFWQVRTVVDLLKTIGSIPGLSNWIVCLLLMVVTAPPNSPFRISVVK